MAGTKVVIRLSEKPTWADSMDCPNSEMLELYVLQRLTRAESEAMEDHIIFCEPCQTKVEAESSIVAILKKALTGGTTL